MTELNYAVYTIVDQLQPLLGFETLRDARDYRDKMEDETNIIHIVKKLNNEPKHSQS